MDYLNSSLDIDKRIEDLLTRMTLDEKINEMHVRLASADSPKRAALANNLSQREAIDNSRLGIPVMLAREISHGVNTTGVTCFPVAICMASTWNTNLVAKIAAVIASEARSQGVHQGISPVLDISRDPRWGRMEESFGEDTLLTCKMAVSFVQSLQGSTLDTDHSIIATAKHFVGYGAGSGGKDNNPIEISERTLEETYFPPFKSVIQEANLQAIMACWGSVNGMPCTANKKLITDKLAEWGFDGFVMDDCPGTAGLLAHGVAVDIQDAVHLAINAGIDMQFRNFSNTAGGETSEEKFNHILLELVKQGKVSESRIDKAVSKVLRAKFRLGLFEKTYVDPDRAEEIAKIPKHKSLAYQVAAEGVILLKNDNQLLPLRSDITSIAVIGPNADTIQLGDYSGNPKHPISPLQGIRSRFSPDTDIHYAKGCSINPSQEVLEEFSLRFVGTMDIDYKGDYEFYLLTNRIACLWIDDKKILEVDGTDLLSEKAAAVSFERGFHSIRIEFINYGSALKARGNEREQNPIIRLLWSSKSIDKQVVPARIFSHVGHLGVQQDGVGEGLKMELFLGADIEDDLPEQTQIVSMVDFEWGEDSPMVSHLLDSQSDTNGIRQAAQVASRAQVAVVFVGEASSGSEQICGEHYDRANIDLPKQQQQLVQAIVETRTPTVVVLINGRSLSINWIAANVPAVLEAWYPGEQGGNVIADILCGRINPSGKLPVSIPRSSGQLPVYYDHRPQPGYYIDTCSEPLFPFGFGLSYTTYEYRHLKIRPSEPALDEIVNVSVEVTNTGNRVGHEIVQLYISDVVSSVTRPVKQLRDFCKIKLEPGQTKTVEFYLGPKQLSLLNQDLQPIVEPGEFLVMVGSNSADTLQASFWLQNA